MNAALAQSNSPASCTCAWCGAFYAARPGPTCSRCGGPLPSPPGPERGPAPPFTPRSLPAGFKRKALITGNVISLVGLVFVVTGVFVAGLGLMLMSLDDPKVWLAVASGLLFSALGVWIVWLGWRGASRRLRALEWGDTAKGELLSLQPDTSEEINGRNPWRIDFTFEVRGEKQVGSVSCWDPSTELRQPGEPVWVVYDPEDPRRSALWPPHG
jgi:hypothetical protein